MRIVRVIVRVAIAVLGGYAASAALSAAVAWLLPRVSGMQRSEAVVLGSMLGYLIYLGLIILAFSVRRTRVGVTPAPGLRAAMEGLHTWCGVVLGGVLCAVFWMGSLSVFDREIDRWMSPATRLEPPPATLSLDALVRDRIAELAPGAQQWSITLPTERTPTLQVRYRDADGELVVRHLDPRSGRVLDGAGSAGGTGFIFPFHYTLHVRWKEIGIWLVGLAGMAMLVLMVSGVLIHVRIFREFFTFRPSKALTRSSLDLHTSAGVLALPFHLVMPLSGLIIFFSIFFPSTWRAAYLDDRAAFTRETFGTYERAKLERPAPLASLDAMRAEAERAWGAGDVSSLRVRNAGDAASVVEARRSSARTVAIAREQLYFDGVTGRVLERFDAARPVLGVQSFIAGLHFTFFDHWTLRWLYFASGLSGCVLIATGYLFWLESRRARHAALGLSGVRCVEVLTIGSVSGIVLSTFAFFIANRLLPGGAALAGLDREGLERAAFYTVWTGTFVHAALRRSAAWREQCWAIAAAGLSAVALNWITTGDHIVRALRHGAWSVAVMDVMLIVAALVATAVAQRLSRTARARAARDPDASPAPASATAPG